MTREISNFSLEPRRQTKNHGARYAQGFHAFILERVRSEDICLPRSTLAESSINDAERHTRNLQPLFVIPRDFLREGGWKSSCLKFVAEVGQLMECASFLSISQVQFFCADRNDFSSYLDSTSVEFLAFPVGPLRVSPCHDAFWAGLAVAACLECIRLMSLVERCRSAMPTVSSAGCSRLFV